MAIRSDLKPERLDLRPERPNLRPERPDLRSEGPDGGGTNKRTNKRTNESPPVFYRTLSPSGPLPKRGLGRRRKSKREEKWRGNAKGRGKMAPYLVKTV